MTDPYVGSSRTSASTRAASRRATRCSTRPPARPAPRPHPPDAREPPRSATRSAPGRSPRRGPEADDDGETPSVDTAPIRLEAMSFPDLVISVAIEPKTKADQDKLATRSSGLAEEDPTFRVRTDEETADAHRRDGRAAPGDHRRPAAARVLGRRERRPTAGRLPRDGRQARGEDRGRFVRQTGGRGQYGHVVIDLEPARPGTATSSSTRSSAARSRASTSRPRRRPRHPGGDGVGHPRRLPVVDIRIVLKDGVPSTSTERDGVQGRGLHGLQGGHAARSRSCSSR